MKNEKTGTINFQWDRVPQRNRFLVFVILLIYRQKKICSNVLIHWNFWNVNVVLNLQNLSKTMISIWIHRWKISTDQRVSTFQPNIWKSN